MIPSEPRERSGVEIYLPGEVASWQRPRASGKRFFNAAKPSSYSNALTFAARCALGCDRPFDGPVLVIIAVIRKWPQRISKRARAASGSHWVSTRPDLDNHTKLVLDALQGVIFHDDGQVAMQLCVKRYGNAPGLHVTVRPLA